jgi:hypothetical protein
LLSVACQSAANEPVEDPSRIMIAHLVIRNGVGKNILWMVAAATTIGVPADDFIRTKKYTRV